jgi:hypothetical protein
MARAPDQLHFGVRQTRVSKRHATTDSGCARVACPNRQGESVNGLETKQNPK